MKTIQNLACLMAAILFGLCLTPQAGAQNEQPLSLLSKTAVFYIENPMTYAGWDNYYETAVVKAARLENGTYFFEGFSGCRQDYSRPGTGWRVKYENGIVWYRPYFDNKWFPMKLLNNETLERQTQIVNYPGASHDLLWYINAGLPLEPLNNNLLPGEPGYTDTKNHTRLNALNNPNLYNKKTNIAGNTPGFFSRILSTVGGKINLTTGFEEHTLSLMHVKGARDLDFTLIYSSNNEYWYDSHNVGISKNTDGTANLNFYGRMNLKFLPPADLEQNPQAYWLGDNLKTREVKLRKNEYNQWVVSYEDGTQLLFNSQGKLLQDTNNAGESIIYSYTPYPGSYWDEYKTITDEKSGKHIKIQYLAYNVIYKITNSNLETVELGYTKINYSDILTQIKYRDDKIINYVYDAEKRLTEIRDASGQLINQNTYDIQGRVTSQTDARGNTTQIQYFEDPEIKTVVTDRRGKKWTYVFDNKLDLVKCIKPSGAFWEYTTSARGEPLTMKSPEGVTFQQTYDAAGNPVDSTLGQNTGSLEFHPGTQTLKKMTRSTGRVIEQTLDGQNRPKTISADNGASVTFNYNPEGQLKEEINHLGEKTERTYENGLLKTIKSPSGLTVSLDYDACGRLTTITSPGNRISRFAYNSLGLVTSTTDSAGKQTRFEYDSRNRLTKTTLPDNTEILKEYDWNHNLTAVIEPGGRRVDYQYDAEDRLTKIIFPGNKTTTIVRDDDGNVVKTIDPENRETIITVNNDGIPTGSNQPGGISENLEFDNLGRTKALTDAAGQRWETTYNSLNQPVETKTPEGRIRKITYDADGKPIASTLPSGISASRTYNPLTRVEETTYPNGGKAITTYDSEGRTATIKSPEDRTTSFSYNTEGLLESITKPSGRKIELAYRPDGELLSKTTEQAITFGRNALGRVNTITKGSQTDSRLTDHAGRLLETTQDGETVKYDYDNRGLLSKITYPDLGTVEYFRNNAGEITSIVAFGETTQISANIAEKTETLILPNQVEETRTFDTAGRLQQSKIRKSDGTIILEKNLGYSPDGNLISEIGTSTRGQSPLFQAEYNKDNQITRFNGTSLSRDGDGNLTSVPTDSGTQTATYNTDGQIISCGSISYQYNNSGLLTSTGEPGVLKTIHDTAQGLNNMLAVKHSDGSWTNYVYLGNKLLYAIRPGTAWRAFHHFDAQGNTVAITDGTGEVTDRISYEPWGLITTRTGSTPTPFLFGGEFGCRTDSHGLVHMRARTYSPHIRQFLTEDQIQGNILNPESLNKYGYAHGNPLTYIDPTGHFAKDVWNFTGDVLDAASGALSYVPDFTDPETTLDALNFGGLLAKINDRTRLTNDFIELAHGAVTNQATPDVDNRMAARERGDLAAAGVPQWEIGLRNMATVAEMVRPSIQEAKKYTAIAETIIGGVTRRNFGNSYDISNGTYIQRNNTFRGAIIYSIQTAVEEAKEDLEEGIFGEDEPKLKERKYSNKKEPYPNLETSRFIEEESLIGPKGYYGTIDPKN